MKIIHLSDIHIGQSNNYNKFTEIVRRLIKQSIETIVITGDFVDDGSCWQYEDARRQIDILKDEGFTVIYTPGNHDYGINGITEKEECISRFKYYISGDVSYPHCEIIDDYAFISLDSMQEEMKNTETWGAQGELGESQIRDLDKLLDDLPINMKIVVLLHHHPFYYNYFLRLRDATLLKQVLFSKKQKISGLLFGHKHVEKRFREKELMYNIDVIFASGSSVERNTNGKLEIPVIDFDNRKIIKI